MSAALTYEYFCCQAFGYPNRALERGEDPAGMANTDFFSERKLASVKATVAYSMEIFSSAIENGVDNLNDQESDRISAFPGRVINASGLTELQALISEYQSSVLGVYFQGEEGVLTLK